jgi:hypothetical protein
VPKAYSGQKVNGQVDYLINMFDYWLEKDSFESTYGNLKGGVDIMEITAMWLRI